MKNSFKILAVTLVLLVTLSGVVLPCRGEETASEQSAKNQYQSFLTEVMGLDLAKYFVNMGYGPNHGPQSGISYGLNFPPEFGGDVKEEGLACDLNSSQSYADSSCILDNGVITVCTVGAVNGALIYNQSPPPSNLVDAAKYYIKKYEGFVTQTYSRNTDYLQQALSCLDGVDGQTSIDKVVGNMDFKLVLNGNGTYFTWDYTQNSIISTFKGIGLAFGYGSLYSLGDSWDLYSVSNVTSISEADAETVAFAAAQNYNLTAAFYGSSGPPGGVQADWSNMTYDAMPGFCSGKAMDAQSIVPISYAFPSNTTRDALTLYPFWSFTFYFSKPIGETLGLQVGVWADTGEVAYCTLYGYLGGPPNTTPQPTNGQLSFTPQAAKEQPNATPQPNSVQSLNGTGQNSLSQLQNAYTLAAVVVAAAAITIGIYLIVRKRTIR